MHIGKRIFNFCHPAFDGALHADRHFSRDNIYQIRGDRSSSQVITRLSLGKTLPKKLCTQKEGTRSFPPCLPLFLLVRCLSLLVFLHVLLHPLLTLGHHLRQLGFLVGSQNLIRLRGYLRVQHFKLSVYLRFLTCNGLRLGLIKRAALNELHHLLMAISLLCEQGLHSRFLSGDDLLDLRLLRIGEIKNVG